MRYSKPKSRATRSRCQSRESKGDNKVVPEGPPRGARALHLDRHHLAPLAHAGKGGAPAHGGGAREGEVAAEVLLRDRSHGVQRALDMPAAELLGGDGGGGDAFAQHALGEIEALLEVPARVDGEIAGHPEVVERVVHGAPRPPSSARGPAGPALEL